MTEIYIHRYQLKRKQEKANSQTHIKYQKGALIKVLDEEGNYGVADLCPWPSLGDLNLEKELEVHGPLFQRALFLAKEDLKARQNKIKWGAEHFVRCHTTINDYKNFDLKNLNNSIVKLKADTDIVSLADFLNKNSSLLEKIRIDFNCALDKNQYFEFEKKLTVSAQEKIEYVEDPFPFSKPAWEKAKLKICSDFVSASDWPYQVVKPTRSGKNIDTAVYLTSAMDHPVGLAYGIIQAEKQLDKVHGFLTLDQYEENDFCKNFKLSSTGIQYINQGYGLGFDEELKNISWEPLVDFSENSLNHLFFKLEGSSVKDRQDMQKMKDYFDQQYGPNGYFLIASSGSSVSLNESFKVYAIKKMAFLKSANRVNEFYNLNSSMNWGCVLPTYHVGGLSILARSHLLKSKVFFTSWKNFSIDWLIENQIQVISLVPTQIHDIVKHQIKCPECLKFIFVGGAHLDTDLANQAIHLGWPLKITFGMTETSSMFAYKENIDQLSYKSYPGVEISSVEGGYLKVTADSLADRYIQLKDEKIQDVKIEEQGSYITQDIIEIVSKNEFIFKSKSNDQIKIKGYGVSLALLRQTLEAILINQKISINSVALTSVADLRGGERIVLVHGPSNTTDLSQVFLKFNEQVKNHEKIYKIICAPFEIPLSELGKIQYGRLKEMINSLYIQRV